MTDKALAERLRDDIRWLMHAATVGTQNEAHPEHSQYIARIARVRADLDLIERMAQAEPVAWAATDESGTVVEALGMNQSRRFDTALYLAPPAREPLSNEEIDAALQTEPEMIWVLGDARVLTAKAFKGVLRKLARAVEQAVWEKNDD